MPVIKVKRVWEKIPLAVDYREVLKDFPAEVLLESSYVQIFDIDTDADVTTDMLVVADTGPSTDTKLQAGIQAGMSGKTYRVEFHAQTQNFKFQEDVLLKIAL